MPATWRIHVDEALVQMLATGHKKPHRAYVWGYVTTTTAPISAVVYDLNKGTA